ncbi:MAG TPA: hypothetical protein VG148_12210 [Pyrinomonadaceae bacterium]|nr:hypothetical protein [Pyrinomonadaceae bacterium]
MRDFKTSRRAVSCALAVLFAAAAAEAKPWRRVVPLRTTRAEVERRFGKPDPKSRHYEFRSHRAFVVYAGGDGCAEGSSGWDVPRDTVVQIIVTPKRRLRFSRLRLDMTKFRKAADPETPAHTLYTNEEDGVTYRVFEGGGEYQGRVLKIQYDPAAEDAHLRCPAQSPPPADPARP